MKIPRDITGREIVRVLCRSWGYSKVHQVGSHIMVETSTPTHQRIAVPDHNPVRIGTLNNILRSVAAHKGVDKQDIITTFQ